MHACLKHIAVFSSRVIHNVSALITGGVVAAGVFIYEHFENKSIPMNAVYCGLCIFFIVGSFQAWRKQFMESEGFRNSITTLFPDMTE